MIKDTYRAFRSAGAEEDPTLQATDALAEVFRKFEEANRIRNNTLDFIKYLCLLGVGLVAGIFVKVWFLP